MESTYLQKKDKMALAMGYKPCERSQNYRAHAQYKYGCEFCADACVIVNRKGKYTPVNINASDAEGSRLYCPHIECPYAEELNKYRSYADYDRHARAHWRKKIAIF